MAAAACIAAVFVVAITTCGSQEASCACDENEEYCELDCACDPDCSEAEYPYPRCSEVRECSGGCEDGKCIQGCSDKRPCPAGFSCVTIGFGDTCRKDCETNDDCSLAGSTIWPGGVACCQSTAGHRYCGIWGSLATCAD